MDAGGEIRFSGPATIFQERSLPETATPAGYAALIGACRLAVPLPRTFSAIGERHRIVEREGWRIVTPRHAPHPTLIGRLHRYLVHHVLAERGFNTPGVVFPVSEAIHGRIDDYRAVLESYSGRLLPLIEWEATESFNVRVLNDTGDFYRFFDATPHAEFLYACVQKTIEEDLSQESDFLRRYDSFRGQVEAFLDMPGRTIDLLFRFLHRNDGTLSRRARATRNSRR